MMSIDTPSDRICPTTPGTGSLESQRPIPAGTTDSALDERGERTSLGGMMYAADHNTPVVELLSETSTPVPSAVSSTYVYKPADLRILRYTLILCACIIQLYHYYQNSVVNVAAVPQICEYRFVYTMVLYIKLCYNKTKWGGRGRPHYSSSKTDRELAPHDRKAAHKP